jgi:glycosyltransferase involved in cell wall biosynthesis
MFPVAPYPTTSVVICTLNEEDNLRHVLPYLPSWIDEVLLVDGHSTDRTIEIAKSLKPDLTVLFQPGIGKGDALRHGIRHATGDIIVTLDADYSADPQEISRFVEYLLNGYDFAKGSRFLLGGGTRDMLWHRRLGNFAFVTLFNLLYGTKYTDLCYGYNAFWKKALREIKFSSDGYEDDPDMHVRVRLSHLRVVEVPSFERPRLKGSSKSPAIRQGLKTLKSLMRGLIQR